ncbi:MAG: hypothetical protein V1847_01045 [Candidatus Diapherotrites archaeon]
MRLAFKVVLIVFVFIIAAFWVFGKFNINYGKWNSLNEKFGLNETQFLPNGSAQRALYEGEATKMEVDLRMPWNDSEVADLAKARLQFLDAVRLMEDAQEKGSNEAGVSPNCSPTSNLGKAKAEVERAIVLLEGASALQEKTVHAHEEQLPYAETGALEAMQALLGQWNIVLQQLKQYCA